ncbi:MAG: ion transporter [Gammaproteobacteria bacterium]|nr:ion transporter [Gammaproteobacteria bacterium]
MAANDIPREGPHGPGTTLLRSSRRRELMFELLERSRDTRGLSRVVDGGLVVLILLNVVAVLLESMEFVELAFADQFRYFEIFSVAIFSIEYLLRMWVCVEADNAETGDTAIRLRLRYATSPMAIIDLLAVLPFYLGALGLLGVADMRVLRVLRLLRLFKLTRYADSMSLLWRVLRENASNFAAALGVLLIVMILAASGMYLLERQAQPDAFGSIPSAMWWAFATLTTVGYGDVTPITPIGKVFGAAITVVSIGIVALPAGLLASSFSARLRQNAESYRDAADLAAADGIVTEEERRALEQKRRELGLGADLAADILGEEQTRRMHVISTACPTCGHDPAATDREERSSDAR